MTFDGTCERGGFQRAPQETEKIPPANPLFLFHRFLVPCALAPSHPAAVAATNNLTTDLLPTREVSCAWPAPALAGWYCYLGILPLRTNQTNNQPQKALLLAAGPWG